MILKFNGVFSFENIFCLLFFVNVAFILLGIQETQQEEDNDKGRRSPLIKIDH